MSVGCFAARTGPDLIELAKRLIGKRDLQRPETPGQLLYGIALGDVLRKAKTARRADYGFSKVLIAPDESAHSVGRIARLSKNVPQPDHFLANYIAGHKGSGGR